MRAINDQENVKTQLLQVRENIRAEFSRLENGNPVYSAEQQQLGRKVLFQIDQMIDVLLVPTQYNPNITPYQIFEKLEWTKQQLPFGIKVDRLYQPCEDYLAQWEQYCQPTPRYQVLQLLSMNSLILSVLIIIFGLLSFIIPFPLWILGVLALGGLVGGSILAIYYGVVPNDIRTRLVMFSAFALSLIGYGAIIALFFFFPVVPWVYAGVVILVVALIGIRAAIKAPPEIPEAAQIVAAPKPDINAGQAALIPRPSVLVPSFVETDLPGNITILEVGAEGESEERLSDFISYQPFTDSVVYLVATSPAKTHYAPVSVQTMEDLVRHQRPIYQGYPVNPTQPGNVLVTTLERLNTAVAAQRAAEQESEEGEEKHSERKREQTVSRPASPTPFFSGSPVAKGEPRVPKPASWKPPDELASDDDLDRPLLGSDGDGSEGEDQEGMEPTKRR